MARAAGITMSECRLLEEHGRRHFMTRRFDRLADGGKLHMQSLGALAHFDFNQAGAHSYEQAFLAIRRLALPMAAVEEQFRRMLFNIVARNQDDHVKNIAFLMDKRGPLDAGAGLRRHLQLQPVGPLDRHASDDAQRQARRVRHGGCAGGSEERRVEARACRRARRGSPRGGRAMAGVCRPRRRRCRRDREDSHHPSTDAATLVSVPASRRPAVAKRPRPTMCQLNLMSLRTRKTHPRRKYALP